MRSRREARSVIARRWPELGLLLGGALLVGWSASVQLARDAYQRTQARELNAALISDAAAAPATVSTLATRQARVSRPHAAARAVALGRLEIPRLRVSAMIAEGTDAHTLDRAVGHVRATALPGQRGNVALAGHRDTFFRGLKGVRRGDEIRITTRTGTFAYRVVSTAVLAPGRTDVMRPTRSPTLTLITCYPFEMIGHAPQRFVVRARRVA